MPNSREGMTAVTLEHPDGTVRVVKGSGGIRLVEVRMHEEGRFCSWARCETRYPIALIEAILGAKGPSYVCDDIQRDKNPKYVQTQLNNDLLSYIDPSAFAGRRILDLGCGSGSSTAILGRMFPDSEIVAVDLLPEYVAVARAQVEHHGYDRVRVLLSPAPDRLPDGIGRFDFIVLSAAYEHVLPGERRSLTARLWEALIPGGVLFINQTPYRWSLIESHTSGLPFLNYLAAFLTVRLRVGSRNGA